MKIVGTPVVARTSTAPLKRRVETPQQIPIQPPLPKAEANAMLAGADGRTTATLLERPKAPWLETSKAIANEALAAAKGKRGDDAVKAVVEHVLKRPELARANVSCVVGHANGEIVVEKGGDKPVNPCSNAKLVTAAFALSTLKPTHRFQTQIARSPDGTLFIKGGFDPTFTRASLVDIVKALQARDPTLKEIQRIVVDNGALVGGNVPSGFLKYGEQDWEYLSRPEPLSIERNLVELVVTPGAKPGDVADVAANTTAFAMELAVETVDAGTEFKIACDEQDAAGVLQRDENGKAIIKLWGTIAADYHKGKKLKMKSPSPQEHACAEVRNAFASAGIRVGVVEMGETAADASVVHTHNSAPLSEVLKDSLANSNAFDHEMMALATTHAIAGARGAGRKPRHRGDGAGVSLDDAAKALTDFVQNDLGGAGSLANGSGIGNESTLSSKTVFEIFTRANTSAKYAPILDALSEPGISGTLKTRMIDTPGEHKFKGKTGTGDRALALSGVCGDLVMSLLVENTRHKREQMRAVVDAMAIALSALEDTE